MNFEATLLQAKEGRSEAVMEIVEMYKPLLITNAIVDGVFDEELYQELTKVLLICIGRFQTLE